METAKGKLGMWRVGFVIIVNGVTAILMGVAVPAWAQEPKGAPAEGPKEAKAPAAAPKAAAAAPAAEAVAEPEIKYESLPVSSALRNNPQKLNEVKQIVHKVLQGTLPLEDNLLPFTGYFTAYLFPMMTQPENLAQLPKARETLFKDFLRRQVSPEAHDKLIKLTLEQMTKIARGNFHPSARMNAMLIIGELNTTETNPAQRITEQPMLEALNLMLDEISSANQIDAVRVAALVGIMRHAEVDRLQPAGGRKMPASAAAAIVVRLTPLITAKEPPANRSAAGQAWMQRRAIEIIGSLGLVDKNEAIPLALEALLADESAPYSLRVTAAAALGRVAPASKKLDVGEAARKMGALAAEIFGADREDLAEQERKIKEREKAQRAAGGAGVGAQPVDPASDPDLAIQRKQLEPIRRRLKQLLGDVNVGLVGAGKEGILPLVTKEPAKAKAKDIADSVAGLLAVVEKGSLSRQEFLELSEAHVQKLRTVARAPEEKKPAATPAKPGGPKAEFGDDELK